VCIFKWERESVTVEGCGVLKASATIILILLIKKLGNSNKKSSARILRGNEKMERTQHGCLAQKLHEMQCKCLSLF